MHEAICASSGLASSHQAPSAWTSLVLNERLSLEALEAYSNGVMLPLNQAHHAGEVALEQVFEAEEGLEMYAFAHSEAVEALLFTPAPTLGAVLKKLEVAQSGGVCGEEEGARLLSVLLSDLRRLLGVKV